MTSSNTGPFGRFTYDVRSDAWWWSDAVYEIHGFMPGEVVPTTELMLSHKHPEDIAAAERLMATTIEHGDEFALWHRVIDAQTKLRQVMTVGSGVKDSHGRVAEIRGFMVDVTEPHRRATAAEVDEAVAASAESRAGIEQIKGALMLSYGIDADQAFDLLRRYSQVTNVKVREVARLLTSMLSNGGMPKAAREMFDRLRIESGDHDGVPARNADESSLTT